MLTALIVDDEPLAHEVILHHLAQHQDIRVEKSFYRATDALVWLTSNSVDLLFLDINMPEMNGIALLKVLQNRPQVLLVTAHQEFAVDGFDLDVTDYLLKPVSEDRFKQALEKVRARIKSRAKSASIAEHIFVKVDREKRKINLNDISYIEAYGNFVKVWMGNNMVLVSSSLKQLLIDLPTTQFIQIHKSFVINNRKVFAVDTESVTLDCGRKIKAGKMFKHVLKTLF